MNIIIKQFTKILGSYTSELFEFLNCIEQKSQMLVYENLGNVKTDSCNTTLTSREI